MSSSESDDSGPLPDAGKSPKEPTLGPITRSPPRSLRDLFPAPGDHAVGVLPPRLVRLACFAVLSLGLLAVGFVCILAVWDAAPRDVAWKSVATLGIVALVMTAFTVLNERFGPLTDA